MATRRPKVPRATPAAPKSPDTGDGGDVIQADFSGSRGAQAHAAGSAAPGPRTPGMSAGQHAGSARPGGSASATAPRSSAPPKPGAATPGTHKPGAAKHGSDEQDSVKHGSDQQDSVKQESGKQGSVKHTVKQDSVKQGAANQGAAKQDSAKRPVRQGTDKHGPAKQSKGGDARAAGNHDPVPAKAFSGRMLALFVVMIAITIMLAPTVKIFFEKRAEIAALQADISDKQAQQNELRRQVSRWQDPNYVKQQARDRINMVMPGETGYWVFGSDLPAGSSSGAAGAGSAQDPAELPWVDSLWESIRRSATD